MKTDIVKTAHMKTALKWSSLKVVLVFVLPLLIAACASSPKENADGSKESSDERTTLPDWVNNPKSLYSDSRFLSAVGIGSSRDEASQDAKKQLAESFIVKVRSETQSKSESTLGQNTEGSVSGKTQQNTENALSLQTETYLRGAEVKESVKVGKEYYALVALDKLSARSGLLLEANRLKTKLTQDLDTLEALFTQKKLEEAKRDLAKIEELYGEATALGMSALIDVTPEQARLHRIENGARLRNSKLIFSVKTIKGETYFERDIQACINDRGGVVFTADQAPKNSNRIEMTVVERPQHLNMEGWQKIRFDLTGAVVQEDGHMYRVQVSNTETGRSREAILETMADKLSHDFCENLFSRMGEARQ